MHKLSHYNSSPVDYKFQFYMYKTIAVTLLYVMEKQHISASLQWTCSGTFFSFFPVHSNL